MTEKKSEKEVQKTKDVPLIDKITGVYANLFKVQHNQEEFQFLFITLINEVAEVTAKVIVTPGHMKRLIETMQENLELYEGRFGQIHAAPRLGNVGGDMGEIVDLKNDTKKRLIETMKNE